MPSCNLIGTHGALTTAFSGAAVPNPRVNGNQYVASGHKFWISTNSTPAGCSHYLHLQSQQALSDADLLSMLPLVFQAQRYMWLSLPEHNLQFSQFLMHETFLPGVSKSQL